MKINNTKRKGQCIYMQNEKKTISYTQTHLLFKYSRSYNFKSSMQMK